MPSSRKKVIVRKFSRDWLAGYLPMTGFVQQNRIELLDLAGKVAAVPLVEVKWLCFVRDFSSGETGNPERLLRKSFSGRPRSEGLWVRLRLTDNDTLEGLAANDRSMIESDGLLLTPPDIRSNTQLVFVPRASIAELEVLAVITGSTRQKIARPTAPGPRQVDLFSEPE